MGRRWGQFSAWIAGSLFAALALAFGLAVLLDPYGRLGIRKSHEIGVLPDQLLKATRAIDPQFDSAIIGNSTSTPLVPDYLDGFTGRSFVALPISGSGPRIQLTILRFFLGQHPGALNIVIGLEDSWCASNLTEQHEFPYWLYSGMLPYAWGLARNTSMRLLLSVSDYRETARLDGYHGYEGAMVNDSKYQDIAWIKKSLQRERPTQPQNGTSQFPAMEMLASIISEAPHVSFVVVWTPRYINLIPEPGSAAEITDRACKAELSERVANFANARVLDWAEDSRPENSDPANFYDFIHYRLPLAEHMERDVATTLNALSEENR